jgi:hypothetical protein
LVLTNIRPLIIAPKSKILLRTVRAGRVRTRQDSWGAAHTPIRIVGISKARRPFKKTAIFRPNLTWGDLKIRVKIPKTAIISPMPISARAVQKHFMIMVPITSQTGKMVSGPKAIKSPNIMKGIPKTSLFFMVFS